MASQSQAPRELTHQQRFFNYFQHEITALQDQMDRLADTPLIAGERSDAADHCLAGITRLSSEVKDAAGGLPAYDQRTYTEAIKALQEQLEEARKLHAPKPKFSFKSKSPSALSLSDAAEMAAEKRRRLPGYFSSTSSLTNTPTSAETPPHEKAPGEEEPTASAVKRSSGAGDSMRLQSSSSPDAPANTDESSLSAPTTVAIADQSHTHIILPPPAVNAQTPCSLQKLSGCVVDLSIPTTAASPFASLTVNSARQSLLLCGWVAGPAHLTGIQNSVLVIKCRQVRMHECENVDVYLDCSSRPIIEACKGIRFAVLPKSQADSISASQPTGTDSPNQWDQVDDFKWLRPEPSPNWSRLPAADTVPDETWVEVVPGGPGWSINDILKAVGIRTDG